MTNEQMTPTAPEVKKLTKRDYAFFWSVFAASLFLCNSTLYGGFRLGFTIGGLLMFALSAVYLRDRIRMTPMATLTLAAIVCVFISFAIWETRFTFGVAKLVFLLCAVPLFFAYSGAFPEKHLEDYRTLTLPFNTVCTGLYGVTPLLKSCAHTKGKRSKSLPYVFIGLAISAPLVIVLALLLASGDAAFENLLENLDINLDEFFITVVYGSVLFVLAFSGLYALRSEKARTTKEDGKGYFALLDGALIATVLTVVSVLYAVFVLAQFDYFFNAFSGIRPEEYTFSEYARRGFGELCTVCIINLILFILSEVLVARDEAGKMPKSVSILLLFVDAFSLLLIAISFAKMVMYVDAYALTWKRLLPCILMVFLACVFLALLLHILRPKFPFMRMIVLSACVIMTVTALYDPAKMIVDFNTLTYDAGYYDTLDYDALADLGKVSVPALRRYTEDVKARDALTYAKGGYDTDDFRGYSLVYLLGKK